MGKAFQIAAWSCRKRLDESACDWLKRWRGLRVVMGVHHFQLAVLPKAYWGAQLPAVLSNAEAELGLDVRLGWWACHPPLETFLAAVRTLLPNDRSWADTEEYVSEGEWGSDVRIWKEEGKVWNITFRFSPMTDGWPLMQRFLALVREEQHALLEGNGEGGVILEPEEGIVRKRFENSRAMRFMRDPKGTIVAEDRRFE